MAKEQTLNCVSIPASADLSTKQYLFVDVNANGQAAVVSTLGAKSIGILQDKPSAQGNAGAVAFSGITKAVFSGTINPGTAITASATGKVVAAAATHRVHGIVIEDGGADNGIGSILLTLNGGQLNA